MNLWPKVYVAAKPDSPPPSSAIVLQSTLMVEGTVNVQVQLVGLCGPLMVLVPEMPLMVQENPESNAHVPDALEPATELVDLNVMLPVQVQVCEEPKMLSVHVTPPLLVKVSVPDSALPSALSLPEKSDLGHLVLRPVASSVQFEFVELAVAALLTGVKDACAGVPTAISTRTAMPMSADRGRKRCFM